MAVSLPSLPALPKFESTVGGGSYDFTGNTDFLSPGSGWFNDPFLNPGGGGGYQGPGGFDTWGPVQLPGTGGGSSPAPGGGYQGPGGSGTVSQGAASSSGCHWYDPFSYGQCLLRVVLLILGLIAIAGAIYLYKPSEPMGDLIGAIKKMGGGAARGVKRAATTAGTTAGEAAAA
jgi:hypothetical protein